MDNHTLIRLFETNARILERNSMDISDEEGLLLPEKGGNCINWMVGHITATRNILLEMMGEGPAMPQEMAGLYKRGSTHVISTSNAVPLPRLLEWYGLSQQALVKALGKMNEDALNKKVNNNRLVDEIAGFHFHEAYHIGQIGYCRRIIGKAGMIK